MPLTGVSWIVDLLGFKSSGTTMLFPSTRFYFSLAIQIHMKESVRYALKVQHPYISIVQSVQLLGISFGYLEV